LTDALRIEMIDVYPEPVTDHKFTGMAAFIFVFFAAAFAFIATAATAAVSVLFAAVFVISIIATHYVPTTFQLKCRE
jgi:hypothetical protein